MANEIGDVLVWGRSWPGHVGMVYDPDVSSNKMKIIHAQGGGKNFHIDTNQSEVEGKYGTAYAYLTDGATIYRPPWDRRGDADGKKRQLQEVAEHIRDSATYGIWRAFRLFAGSDTYGSDARKRVRKYKDRRANGYRDEDGGDAFVTTVTCVEAVTLCYQITFDEADHPFFIDLDAAHTMPRDLGTWLERNWTKVS